jgi:hypothetical protein
MEMRAKAYSALAVAPVLDSIQPVRGKKVKSGALCEDRPASAWGWCEVYRPPDDRETFSRIGISTSVQATRWEDQ